MTIGSEWQWACCGECGEGWQCGEMGISRKIGVAEVRYEIQLIVNIQLKQECKLYYFCL
ncbi:MAG: hypothetical protein F6K22_04000 [Okeania sp. SIO2F4]|uniref:hypothetical protein n=1 Tax=Okeania sp. SIO2F4 TaxID=2607790 RepID=UPI00142B8CEE|nr:hypothetical protein [Okeania sp. SIO2F4]NES02066.1 hypothetical protein [Okeania sp. SIO2F4]